MRNLLYLISCKTLPEALSLTETFKNNEFEWASLEPNALVAKRLRYPQYLFLYDTKTIYQGEYIPEEYIANKIYSAEEFIELMKEENKPNLSIKKELLIKI